jgi:hypothetical protein
VAPVLVGFAKDRLLQPILIERCDDGHIASGLLGGANQPVEAYCNACESRATFRPYVLYEFTGDLVAEAAHRPPKVLRRMAPLLWTLGKVLVRFRPFPARIAPGNRSGDSRANRGAATEQPNSSAAGSACTANRGGDDAYREGAV